MVRGSYREPEVGDAVLAKRSRVTPSRAMPSGTVAFLFSDIEGSTERWERDRAAMAAALRRHDAIVRDAIEKNGGYVFKTIGDAFCAAFETTDAAVAAALAVRRALALEDFADVGGVAVRIALHVGNADERDGDYFGPTLNRVARLLATAHGGQTILSAAATDLARVALPPEATLADLGIHRLKDLAEPESIAQLVVPDLPVEFPPLRSLDAARNNLPTQLLPLVGRDAVVADIETELAAHRVVTLVGSGGIGKTRVALHVAAEVSERFSGGVWYVGLSAVIQGELVASQFLGDLGLRETAGRQPLETVILWLASRAALLVVDNCEQVVEEAARVVQAIAARCAHVCVLATSREALRIDGERVVRVPSLALPPHGAPSSVSSARECEAVALFEARARAIDSRFTLSDANAAIVVDICRRLDGIALAIELAASRISILAPAQLLAKLDERFRLLTGGRRTADARQSTLHAAIAWSYDLLSERDRTIFERDGVFASAFGLEAALAVCADETLDDFAVIDAVEALVNKSLVAVEGDSDVKAYRLLESMRSFALLRLAEHGDLKTSRARHAAYAAGVAERLDAAYLDLPTAEWERAAAAAIPDIRAAIGWAFEAGNDPAVGIAIVANMRWYWSGVSPSEGRALVRNAQCVALEVDVELRLCAKLAIAEAAIATGFGDSATQRDAAARARDVWDALADPLESAIALRTEGQALIGLGETERAIPLLEGALREFRARDCRQFASLTLDTLGMQKFARGEIAAARAYVEEAIALARAAGFERGLLYYNINLAEIEASTGNLRGAIALCEASLKGGYAKREPYTLAVGWLNLAMYLGLVDRPDSSFAAATFGLRFGRESGVPVLEALAFQCFGGVRVAAGDVLSGARLAGFAAARFRESGFERGATERAHYEHLIARATTALDEIAVDEACRSGASMTVAQAARLAAVPVAVVAYG